MIENIIELDVPYKKVAVWYFVKSKLSSHFFPNPKF